MSSEVLKVVNIIKDLLSTADDYFNYDYYNYQYCQLKRK
jgi:hypothetical protein